MININKTLIVNFNKDQCEILEDVLSEIEESRVYEGKDKEILDGLKNIFSYKSIQEYFK